MSPQADFLAAGALLPVGVAALRTADRRDQVILAALPLLFAAHQFVEGFVWLGLQGHVSPAIQDAAIRLYLGFAQVALPVLVPLGLLLVEPDRGRRRLMLGLVGIGAAVGLRLGALIAGHPVGARALDHLIVYDTDARFGYVVATGYVLATCGPALLSSHRMLRWFGVANLAGLAAATAVRYSAVTSVWCLYAGLVSVLILVFLRHEHATRRSAAPDGAPQPTALTL